MRALDRIRAEIAKLEQAQVDEACRLMASHRAPGEPAPSVEEVHANRMKLAGEIEALRRRLTILEEATGSTSVPIV